MSFTDSSAWRQSERKEKSKASVMLPLIILIAAVIACLAYTLSLIDFNEKPTPSVELSS